MKRAIYFCVLCLPLSFILYCSITNDNSRIEGNWWQNNNVSPGSTVSAETKEGSSNQIVFGADRSYSSLNPFTGEQQTGTWTIDPTMRVITVYINPLAGNSNSNNLVISNRYDFPESGMLKLINPSNSSYFIVLKRG